MRRVPAWCACVAALLLGLPSGAASPGDRAGLLPLTAFPRERIVIETRSARRHPFQAWRADTMRTRVQGLMFVEALAPDEAMIFIYTPPQNAQMWMSNTLIPLDMLFVDDGGCIVKVHADAQPGSLATISAERPVAVVVELAGGTAAALGLRVGDRLARPQADWPQDVRPCSTQG